MRQKRLDRAFESPDRILIITGIVALVNMMFCEVFLQGFLSILYKGIAEDVMRNDRIYLVICALPHPSLALYNSCAALFSSTGNAKISMEVSIVMNDINVFGDALAVSPHRNTCAIENRMFQMGYVLAVGIIALLDTPDSCQTHRQHLYGFRARPCALQS